MDDNWFISGRWNPLLSEYKLTEEELLVKIIQSIPTLNPEGELNYSQINDFMDLLNDVQYVTSDTENLYQTLYNKIQDQLLFGDDGNGARGKFVRAVYLLWLNSKYNPGIDESIVGDVELVKYKYVPRDLELQYPDPDTEPSSTTPSPFLINYESHKFLLWYKDDFKFQFYQEKIKVLIKNPNQTVLLSVVPVEWYDEDYYYALFGYYDVFQPISIKNGNAGDTIIQIPVSTDPGNPCAISSENNANIIPIFYLKYIDDLGDYSDFKQSIGVFIDAVLTFTGIGNITKLRHLVKVSVIRRYLAGGVISAAEKAATMAALRGMSFATWEVFIGTVSSVHNLVTDGCTNYLDNPCDPPLEGTPEYEVYEACQAVQGWLFAIEIITLSGDLLAKRFLRRASQNLSDKLPEDFPTPEKNIIDDLADIAGEFADFKAFLTTNGYGNVLVKLEIIESFLGLDKAHAFMFDFLGNHKGLKALNDKPELIDDWAEVVEEFAHHRKNIRFLEAFNRFTNKPHEVEHITDFVNGSTTGGFDPKGAHGGKNLSNGVMRDPSLPAPSGRPKTEVKQSKNGHVSYKHMYFIRPDGSLKKKSLQTIWNPLWDDARIKSEMAFAFMNKRLTRPTQVGKNVPGYSPPPQYTSHYESVLSDGTKVEMKILNFGEDVVTKSIVTDHLDYFQLNLK